MGRGYVRFWDPDAKRFDIPTWPWKLAPAHLKTRDQLVEMGLRPHQPPAGQILWNNKKLGLRRAYLFDIALAGPPKKRSPGQVASLEAARRKRRTCPTCGEVREYTLSTALKECTTCADGLTAAA
ncbi:RRQRL motif-containing zinc-binding protein [Streptomyces sp. NPDC002215]|uniref:RRQRL motif-containing zinc-binding protein n=1 Tax=Streptomyces sp. NPDC002215 TaxID=3154412 RepID=UPI00331C08B3